MDKKLGKITAAGFGLGGYQDACIGLSITIESGGWIMSDWRGGWSEMIKCDSHCKWTEADRSKTNDETVRFVDGILRAAKKQSVTQLVGVPVEVTLDGMTLKSWRVLTEVI